MRSVKKTLARFALACLAVIPAFAAVAASAPLGGGKKWSGAEKSRSM